MSFGLPNISSGFESLLGRIGLPSELPADPFPLFLRWFNEGLQEKQVPNPDAMTLATIGEDSRPAARIVLCRGIDIVRGSVVFYSHRTGRKGRELASRPQAACVFHWDHAGRQARVEGEVSLLDNERSDDYFAHRPLLSRLGAWASKQSEPLPRRVALVEAVRDAARRFGIGFTDLIDPSFDASIPRPPYWGGFELVADTVELWLGGDARLHDRAIWKREKGPAGEAGPWRSTRLYP